jgi:hypothetical protein
MRKFLYFAAATAILVSAFAFFAQTKLLAAGHRNRSRWPTYFHWISIGCVGLSEIFQGVL